ncbi:ATP-binding protein [bacterium]|nr:ATP-binding protein [bacterium]
MISSFTFYKHSQNKSDKVYDTIFSYFSNHPSYLKTAFFPIQKMNIFVGPNNSGKSRFLRAIMQYENYSVDLHKNDFSLNSNFLKMHYELLEVVKNINTTQLESEEKQMLDILQNKFASPQYLGAMQKFITGVNRKYHNGTINISNPDKYEIFIKKILNEDGNLKKELYKELHFLQNRIYIPVLRGLRPFYGEAKDFYAARTKADYEINDSVKVYSGLAYYDELQSKLLGNKQDRDIVKDYEDYLSKTFFNGQEINLIPRKNQDVINVRIGEDERPIFKLGDGIQSIILLTFPLFIEREGLFFIEEPELYLHPGMQRKLVETFLNWDQGIAQFFITTHSNHFLDLAMEHKNLSIFSINKLSEGLNDQKFEIEQMGLNRRTLELLGVRNTSVLLSNCTIWVEGITDRKYFRHYLNLYQKHFEDQAGDEEFREFFEDEHYSFVEYSGNNITHWSFLDKEGPVVEKLCGTLLLIADNDIKFNPALKGKEKDKRITKLRENLGDNFILIENGEIENIIPKCVIRNVVEKHQLKVHKGIPETKKVISQRLGGYIERLVKEGKISIEGANPKEKWAAANGAIKDKLQFCEEALEFISDWADLSEEARKLTKKIYNFIKQHNP